MVEMGVQGREREIWYGRDEGTEEGEGEGGLVEMNCHIL